MPSLVTLSNKANEAAVDAAIVAAVAAEGEVARGDLLALPVAAIVKRHRHRKPMKIQRRKPDFAPTRQPMARRSLANPRSIHHQPPRKLALLRGTGVRLPTTTHRDRVRTVDPSRA
jgi:hypothetical protein